MEEKNVVVVFPNDERMIGVEFPNVKVDEDEFGNIEFRCSHVQLVNFISTNSFQVEEVSIFSDGTGKQINISHFGKSMGQYWNSEEEYKQFKEETKDCY